MATTPQITSQVHNLRVTFGKHKGQRLADIPQDYLEWICKSTEPKYQRWIDHYKEPAQTVLKEKYGLTVSISRPAAPLTPDGNPAKFEDIYQESLPTATLPMKGTGNRLPVVDSNTGQQVAEMDDGWAGLSVGVVNNVSKNMDLLKLFITRQDKELGFYDWLQDIAIDALINGTKAFAANGDGHVLVKNHLGKFFYFATTTFRSGGLSWYLVDVTNELLPLQQAKTADIAF